MAHGSQEYCWSHDPKNQEKRRRNASKAATAKADREIRETKAEIRELVRLVKEESFDVSKANTINRLYQTLLQYIVVERGCTARMTSRAGLRSCKASELRHCGCSGERAA